VQRLDVPRLCEGSAALAQGGAAEAGGGGGGGGGGDGDGDGGGGEDCGNSADSGAAAGECGVGGGVSDSRCAAQARGMHSGLVHPWGALLHEGVLYVSDVGGASEEQPGRVVAIDASESLARIGSFGTGHLRLPAGLALLPARDGARLAAPTLPFPRATSRTGLAARRRRQRARAVRHTLPLARAHSHTAEHGRRRGPPYSAG